MKTWGDFALGAGAGVTATIIVVLLIYVSGQTIEARDWLAFVGAVLGAMVTVAASIFGALYMEHRRRSIETREDVALVRRAIERLDLPCSVGLQLETAEQIDAITVESYEAFRKFFPQALDDFLDAATRCRVRDVKLHFALRELSRYFVHQQGRIESIIKTTNLSPTDVNQLRQMQKIGKSMRHGRKRIVQALEACERLAARPQ